MTKRALAAASAAAPAIQDPVISLAGRDWPMPMLAPRQNRVVVPLLLDVVPRIIRAREDGGGDLAQLARFLDPETYGKLLDLTYHALTRGTPDLDREAFEDLPIDTLDMVGAVNLIARQAGLLKAPRAAAE